MMDASKWNWVQLVCRFPVVFFMRVGCFFERAWKSLLLGINMFTLVGIGSGVAFLFSLVGLFFPTIFPDE
jgi:Cu2+-exporting ATPase